MVAHPGHRPVRGNGSRLRRCGGRGVHGAGFPPNTVVATISGFTSPYAIAITPNGLYAYVADIGATHRLGDRHRDQHSRRHHLSGSTTPYAIAITPNGLYAYVTDIGPSTVSVIDTGTNLSSPPSRGLPTPSGIAITPNGLYAYVTNSGTSTVSVIDTGTNTVVATIWGSPTPTPSPSPRTALRLRGGLRSRRRLGDRHRDQPVAATISGFSNPYAIAITPNGLYAYMADSGPETVSVIDTGTDTVVATISGFGDPYGIAITPNGLYAYVTDAPPHRHGDRHRDQPVVATISGFNNPYGIAITPNGLYAYVAN